MQDQVSIYTLQILVFLSLTQEWEPLLIKGVIASFPNVNSFPNGQAQMNI